MLFSLASPRQVIRLALAILGLSGSAYAQFSCNTPSVGPDLVVGRIAGSSLFGTVGGESAYSFGTTVCNVGDAAANYQVSTSQHPLIGQNLYRIENGRLEQIGMGWMRHTYGPLQQGYCCPCSPAGSNLLGPGCSDTNGVSIDGIQSILGPRSQVNGFTGAFPYPFQTAGQTGDAVYKRLQVATEDIDPANHPGAEYVAEVFVLEPEGAGTSHRTNGFSWQPLTRGTLQGNGGYRLSPTGMSMPLEPAIYALGGAVPGVRFATIQVPGEGVFIASSHVIDNGDGTWRYEYAVQNLNSDLSAQALAIPVGTAVVTDAGMSFPLYHSGEAYSNAPWTPVESGGAITWACAPFGANINANALRFGTTYSYWFTADSPPALRDATVTLFKPGGPGAQTVQLDAPSDGPVSAANYCVATQNSVFATGNLWAFAVDLGARNLSLRATSLPPGQFGFVATSLTPGQINMPGGSAGNLCLGGAIGRLVGGTVFQADAGGTATLTVNLDGIPTPTGTTQVMPGETRYFQAWHRDVTFGGAATSNFTVGLELSFP